MILYITQKSATDTSGELDINNLVRYPNGTAKYEKKYSQNPFFINFWLNVSSASSSASLVINYFVDKHESKSYSYWFSDNQCK